LPYADGATAQTRPNEAAKVGVRSIETYPTLWQLLLFVGVYCRGHGETFDETKRLYMRVIVKTRKPAAHQRSDTGSDGVIRNEKGSAQGRAAC
jgi:hypothetical protein